MVRMIDCNGGNDRFQDQATTMRVVAQGDPPLVVLNHIAWPRRTTSVLHLKLTSM